MRGCGAAAELIHDGEDCKQRGCGVPFSGFYACCGRDGDKPRHRPAVVTQETHARSSKLRTDLLHGFIVGILLTAHASNGDALRQRLAPGMRSRAAPRSRRKACAPWRPNSCAR